MASYTVRVGGTGNKLASVDGDPTDASACMPLATALGESYSAGDVLLFADTGGDYYAILNTPSAGEAGTYFYQQAYPGHSPVFNGSDVTTGWEAHATLPLVWQKTGITYEPSMIWFDDVRGTKKDNAASLTTQMDWCWVSDVAYVYSATDPDAAYTAVELAARRYCLLSTAKPYVITDGLEFKHSDWLSAYCVSGSHHNKFLNCHAHDSMVGFKLVTTADDCTFDSCTSEYHTGDGFAVSGTSDVLVYRMTITNCISRENMYIDGINGGSGTGIKAFGLKDSLVTKSIWNDNDQGGIRFDGGGTIGEASYWGCEYNTVSENILFENGGVGGIDGDPSQVDQIMMEFSDHNDVKFNVVYDCVDGGFNIGLSRTGSCNVLGNITWGASGTSVGSIRTYFSAGGEGRENYIVGNIVDQSWWGLSLNGSGYEIIRNNIFSRSASGSDMRFANAEDALTVDSNYNCFAGGGSGAVTVLGVGHMNLAEWQTYSSQDANSITDDPLFTDPSSRDYTLQVGSPCIDSGDKSLGSPFNEALHPSSDITTAGGMIIVDRDDH